MTCGNVRNAQLQEIVRARWPLALKLLERGEPLVEIGR
jgi:predicted nuclease of predicted toxin-antitoxin system